MRIKKFHFKNNNTPQFFVVFTHWDKCIRCCYDDYLLSRAEDEYKYESNFCSKRKSHEAQMIQVERSIELKCVPAAQQYNL